MNEPQSDPYLARLERGGERLQAACACYRTLLRALWGPFWRPRLRKKVVAMQEAADLQESAHRVAWLARRRALAEGWPARSPAVRLIEDSIELEERLSSAVARRLGRPPGSAPLRALLEELEASVLAFPRRVPASRRWATAVQVLPPGLPVLDRAYGFGRLLESVFSRPCEPGGAVRLEPSQLTLLKASWPEGEAALESSWQRLARVDPSGALLRFLERRAAWAPTRPPRDGPERLLHAAFWHGVALYRLSAARLQIRIGITTAV